MKELGLRVVVLLLCFGVLTPALAGEAKEESDKDGSPRTPPAPMSFDSTYRIGPQDVLDVRVWKEPELSITVPVRPDGKISLPLLNDIQAAGLTPMQLTDQITNRLKDYLTGPRVTVIVTAMNSQRVYIVGQVGRPGPIQLLPEMTVLQALASVGGLTEFANGKRVYVLRLEGTSRKRIQFNYRDALKGTGPAPLILMPGDTIVVP